LDGLGFKFETGQENFLFSKTSKSAPGPTQLPIQWVRWCFPGGKAAGHEVNYSPPYSSEVKNDWNYTSSPPICLHGVNMEKLNFTVVNTNLYKTKHAKGKAVP
jgi:hypothetical protein